MRELPKEMPRLQARTQLALARIQFNREQKLLSLGIAAQADVDTAAAAVAAGQSQLNVLQQQQSAQTSPWAPDVASARAGIAQARAALSAAQQKVAYAALRAPFPRIVIARLHNDGESADPTMPVIQLASNTESVFTAQFVPADAERVHRGDLARITAQSANESVTGHVIAINPAQAIDSKTVPVVIRIGSQNVGFGPGAYGSATIAVGSIDGLVVAASAIVSDPTTGSAQVFRKDGNTFSPVPVTVTLAFGNKTWIESPQLQAGNVVAIKGAYQLAAP